MKEFFSANSRLLSETLARYRDTYIAFCELVNNSLQANSKKIEIKIDQVPKDEISTVAIREIQIKDDGVGVAASDFHEKILNIATTTKSNGKGIGRFSAFQLGATIQISSVAFDDKKQCFTKSDFSLSINASRNQKLSELPIEVMYEDLVGDQKPYYLVKISDFYDEQITSQDTYRKLSKKLLLENLPEELFQSYPDDIVNRDVAFIVNGKIINVSEYLVEEIDTLQKIFVDKKGTNHLVDLSFLHYRSSQAKKKVLLRTENNGVKTVGYEYDFKCDIPDQNNWFIYIDSKLLNDNGNIFRNLVLKDMHIDEELFVNKVKCEIDAYFVDKYSEYFNFKKKLKNDEHYPYKNRSASSETKEFVFNQISFYIEKEFHLLQKRDRIKKLIYPLVDKAINNGHFEELLEQFLFLDDGTILNFKSLIERAEFGDVVQFAQQVAERNQFLDILHQIVYGEPSKILKERSQLHKIIEKNIWVFGEEYSSSPNIFSDKNLENNLNSLRKVFFEYEPTEQDDNLIEIQDDKLRDITDLFFYYERPFSGNKREVTIVELKAPKCRISEKELSQVRRYRYDIEQKGKFSLSLKYRIILVSSEITGFANSQLGKIDNDPFLLERSNECDIEVLVMKWSDLIRHNKERLSYLGNSLNTKDRNLREYLESEFPEVDVGNLQSILA